MRMQMKRSRNPEKQDDVNIVGYLENPKLFVNANQSQIKKNRNLFIPARQDLRNDFYNDRQSMISQKPLTGRHTFLSQNYHNEEQNQYQGFYTSRNYAKHQKNRVSFQQQQGNQSMKVNLSAKNQISSAPRNRFYYNQQQNQHLNSSNSKQKKQKQGLSSPNEAILPGYFTKLNKTVATQRQFSPYSNLSYQKQFIKANRSKSPLQQSHQRLFSKCYKQTYQYLQAMLQQIFSSQQQLYLIRKQLTNNIFQTIKDRANVLRNQLIDLVEQLVAQWERKQWTFAKNNQIQYMDDFLELQEQIKQRQSKINTLIQRLEEERKLDMKQQGSHSKQRALQKDRNEMWKSVTADLLMFNYQDSILQVKELCQKMASTVNTKSSKAISILPSSFAFQKYSHYQMLSSQTRQQLKAFIIQFLNNPKSPHQQPKFSQKSQYSPQMQKIRDSLFTLSQYKAD